MATTAEAAAIATPNRIARISTSLVELAPTLGARQGRGFRVLARSGGERQRR
jgi:hypothetical protein